MERRVSEPQPCGVRCAGVCRASRCEPRPPHRSAHKPPSPLAVGPPACRGAAPPRRRRRCCRRRRRRRRRHLPWPPGRAGRPPLAAASRRPPRRGSARGCSPGSLPSLSGSSAVDGGAAGTGRRSSVALSGGDQAAPPPWRQQQHRQRTALPCNPAARPHQSPHGPHGDPDGRAAGQQHPAPHQPTASPVHSHRRHGGPHGRAAGQQRAQQRGVAAEGGAAGQRHEVVPASDVHVQQRETRASGENRGEPVSSQA